MGSYKPRSKSDRIPVRHPNTKPESQHQMSPSNDFGANLGPLIHTSPETRFDAVRAVAHAHQPETPETIAAAREVLDALGLLPAEHVRPGVKAIGVPCPQCLAPPGRPCVGSSGTEYPRGHRGRHRRAQEAREAAA